MPQIQVRVAAGKTRRTWVVKEILHLIFTGVFQGGDRLVEQELAATLGVSRTPVREAFSELAGIGLIALKPNHGAVVRTFGPAQLREMYQIRRILEAEAARLAAARIDPVPVEEMRGKTQQLLANQELPNWSADVLVLDQQFHELISANSGSTRLLEEIGRYRALVDSIREAVGNTARAQAVALVEHTQIMDQLLSRNGDGAAQAMAQHIARGAEAAVNALFSSGRADGRRRSFAKARTSKSNRIQSTSKAS